MLNYSVAELRINKGLIEKSKIEWERQWGSPQKSMGLIAITKFA